MPAGTKLLDEILIKIILEKYLIWQLVRYDMRIQQFKHMNIFVNLDIYFYNIT